MSWLAQSGTRLCPRFLGKISLFHPARALLYTRPMGPRRLPSNSRKLLIASIGVASVSYVVACSVTEDIPTSGNLMANLDAAALDAPTSGNLMALDTGTDAPTSGNLMAIDAGEDAPSDAADDADGHD